MEIGRSFLMVPSTVSGIAEALMSDENENEYILVFRIWLMAHGRSCMEENVNHELSDLRPYT